MPSLNAENLPAGMDVELPLWAAAVMSKSGRKYVTINIPNKYKEAHR